jgi:hypothetical protein
VGVMGLRVGDEGEVELTCPRYGRERRFYSSTA